MTALPGLLLSQRRLSATAPAQRTPSLRTIEPWFIVCVFVLIASSLWFTSSEASDAALQGSPIAELLWGIVYLFALIGIFQNRAALGILVRQSLPLLAIIGLVLISGLWSVDPAVTVKRAIGLCGTTAFGYYIAARFSLNKFLDILGLTCCIIIFLSIMMIVFIPSMGKMQDEYVGAWRGIFVHKNFLGEFMALSMATFLSILVTKQWPKWMTLAGFAVSSFLLVRSESVSGYAIAALLLLVVCVTALYGRSRTSRPLATWLAVLLALSIAGVLLDGSIRQELLYFVGRDASLTGRTDLWPQVIQAISSQPVLGYGYDAFWLPNGAYNYFISSDWTPAHAHNGYLEICLDTGLVGAFVAVTAMLVGTRRAFLFFRESLPQLQIWPLLMTVYFLLVNLTEPSIAKYNNFSWVLFVIAFLYTTTRNKTIARHAGDKVRALS